MQSDDLHAALADLASRVDAVRDDPLPAVRDRGGRRRRKRAAIITTATAATLLSLPLGPHVDDAAVDERDLHRLAAHRDLRFLGVFDLHAERGRRSDLPGGIQRQHPLPVAALAQQRRVRAPGQRARLPAAPHRQDRRQSK